MNRLESLLCKPKLINLVIINRQLFRYKNINSKIPGYYLKAALIGAMQKNQAVRRMILKLMFCSLRYLRGKKLLVGDMDIEMATCGT